jgi:hypothetical protein
VNLMWRIIAASTVLTAFTGCSDPRERELEEIGNTMAVLAAQCLRDTETIPAEHSRHCIETTRLVHPIYQRDENETSLDSHCTKNDSKACNHYTRTLFHYRALYWRAVAQSIAKFGAPAEPEGLRDRTKIYQFAELMEPYFAECLKEHPDPPKPRTRKAQSPPPYQSPAPKVSLPALENRHCIALGTNKPPMFE